MHLFDNYIWPTTSSLLIFQQKFLYIDGKAKNIFAYFQLINFVVWTHGNDQLKRIITLKHFMIWKYP